MSATHGIPKTSYRVLVVLMCGMAGCAPSGSRSSAAPRSIRTVVPLAGSSGIILYTDATPIEQHVPAGPLEVWAVLPFVFDQLGIEATEVDPVQRVMGNRRFRARNIEGKRLSTYMECGQDLGGNYADTFEVTSSFGVQLLIGRDGGTTVAMMLSGSALRREVSGYAVRCQSKQTLESRVVVLILEGLARGE